MFGFRPSKGLKEIDDDYYFINGFFVAKFSKEVLNLVNDSSIYRFVYHDLSLFERKNESELPLSITELIKQRTVAAG
ncbi:MULTISPECIES: hypothetical protein [Chitinophagaceae]